jgi:hypothetical protein
MIFDTYESKGEDGHSCEDGSDCKFRGKVVGGKKRKGKPDHPPKKKKAKKVALPPKRSGSTSPPNARSSLRVPRSLQESSTREELKEERKCDEERTFLVRVRPGMTQAEVLFLNNVKGDGWEGPFDLEVPLQDLLEFDLLPLPRRAAMIERVPSRNGKEEAPSESKEHSLDKYLTGEREAGLTEIMASVRETNEESKAQESGVNCCGSICFRAASMRLMCLYDVIQHRGIGHGLFDLG